MLLKMESDNNSSRSDPQHDYRNHGPLKHSKTCQHRFPPSLTLLSSVRSTTDREEVDAYSPRLSPRDSFMHARRSHMLSRFLRAPPTPPSIDHKVDNFVSIFDGLRIRCQGLLLRVNVLD